MSKRSKPKRYFNRRQAMGAIGASGAIAAFSNPIGILINGLVDGLFSKAQASGVTNPNYLVLTIGGGPPSWISHPLAPFEPVSNARRDGNKFVNTRFRTTVTNANDPMELGSVPITRAGVTINMPDLWTCQLPTSSGGWVPMADLMPNLLMVNSFTREADGHSDNAVQLERPLGATVSLAGGVADRSFAPVPAAGLPESIAGAFTARSAGIVTQSSGWGLTGILDPFNRPSGELGAAYLSRRDAMDTVVNSVLGSLGTLANSGRPGADALFSIRNRAETLVRQGVGDLASEYNSRFNKYASLMQRCKDFASYPIPGITDRPVSYVNLPKDSAGSCWMTLNASAEFCRNDDLRTIIGPSTYVFGLAESFAIAEYLLVRGYSSSVIAGTPGVYGMNLQNVSPFSTPGQAVGSPNTYWYNDAHAGGPVLNLLTQAFLYRSIYACVYELARTLGPSIWGQTLVQIAGEFSRFPDTGYAVTDSNGVVHPHGTDHGWRGAATALVSGMITAPMVFGNPLRGGDYTGSGTWGAAGNTNIAGANRKLNYGNVASTIATLLEIENPTPNDQTLVTKDSSGVLTPTVLPARIVDT